MSSPSNGVWHNLSHQNKWNNSPTISSNIRLIQSESFTNETLVTTGALDVDPFKPYFYPGKINQLQGTKHFIKYELPNPFVFNIKTDSKSIINFDEV